MPGYWPASGASPRCAGAAYVVLWEGKTAIRGSPLPRTDEVMDRGPEKRGGRYLRACSALTSCCASWKSPPLFMISHETSAPQERTFFCPWRARPPGAAKGGSFSESVQPAYGSCSAPPPSPPPTRSSSRPLWPRTTAGTSTTPRWSFATNTWPCPGRISTAPASPASPQTAPLPFHPNPSSGCSHTLSRCCSPVKSHFPQLFQDPQRRIRRLLQPLIHDLLVRIFLWVSARLACTPASAVIPRTVSLSGDPCGTSGPVPHSSSLPPLRMSIHTAPLIF